jgi:tetratricopeptide (TPR) repeat protein
LAEHPGQANEWNLRLRLANELLEAGESAEAVKELEQTREWARKRGTIPAAAEQTLHNLLGIAYLRLGEQENCLMNHGADSCIFPIQRSAIHQAVAGAQGAIREFTEILNANPADLNARWLLNIAYMVLGQHPERVPAQWVIQPEIFKSDYDLKRFRDIAPSLGLNVTGHAGGVIVEDFDGDG